MKLNYQIVYSKQEKKIKSVNVSETYSKNSYFLSGKNCVKNKLCFLDIPTPGTSSGKGLMLNSSFYVTYGTSLYLLENFSQYFTGQFAQNFQDFGTQLFNDVNQTTYTTEDYFADIQKIIENYAGKLGDKETPTVLKYKDKYIGIDVTVFDTDGDFLNIMQKNFGDVFVLTNSETIIVNFSEVITSNNIFATIDGRKP